MVKLSSLQRKLWRELWHMRGQALAIMLVIVGGVGVCVMSLSTYDSLRQTRDNYYRDYGFADIFTSLKRAPQAIMARVREIPGVRAAESRVVAQINLEVPNFADPVTGLLSSLPDHGQPGINRLHILRGRLPDSLHDNEALISDAFADAQKLNTGDHIIAIINGKRRELTIVGIALSPEYIYQIAPGAVFPDYQRFGVLWMARTPLATAYGMQGAFNDVVIRLQPGVAEDGVIEQLDNLLNRYGSQGAYGRDEQFSNLFLKEEFAQLETMAYLFPAIFLGVAVFLLNVVVTRLIQTQREIIAILKAFGYSNRQIGSHYAELVLLITGLGIAGGFVLGIYLGQLMTSTYTDYYRFPSLLYRLSPLIFFAVGSATVLAALLGTWRAVHKATILPPAEAMRPEPPQHYSQSILERMGMQRLLSQPSRMILRHLQRKPVKTLLSVVGLAMATAIMMVGNFQQDAVHFIMHVQFQLTQKQDIEVTLYEPVASNVLDSLRGIHGVYYVEGLRSVPVSLEYQQREYRTSIQGIPADAVLQSVLNTELENIRLPEEGLMVTEHLAHKLGFKTGDRIWVKFLDGKRQHLQITVAMLSQQYLGVGAYMRRDALNRLLGEGPAINTLLLKIDNSKAQQVYKALKEMPAVASINLRQSVIDSFRKTMKQILLVFTFINALLGAVIAFGVVYNTVRIALAERGRELASMRVLGYTHGEVAYILLGEMAVLTLLSIPIGFVIGVALCQFLTDQMQSDLYRVPLILSPFTYSFSALVVMLSALTSAGLVWYRLKRLNLVEVLKTRE